ncbi:hypothetical protein ACFFUB_08345 [Algimonas porphyrae]|uniref:Alpha/beta hydrolase n=1 Tax=Algimonas porphyrae TaxID=1128113 RepID=A0ABQ5V5V8_9PROT|nr:hypothetical protein [Algimonas porphyrae]GLQ22055.1 hypothetical protein GCM10007854_30100 [Algimonas porphyrae]
MRWDLIGLTVAGLVLLIAVLSREPEPDLLRFEVDGTRAYGYGFTDGRTERVIARLSRDHPQVDTLVFVDMPGTADLMANYRLGHAIRKAGYATELLPSSRIASGAVYLFLAGMPRRVACGAQIGVHAWGYGGDSGIGAQDAIWDTNRSYMRGYLIDMSVDPDFYDFSTRAADSDEIHWMSVVEINRWGLTSQPLSCDQSK